MRTIKRVIANKIHPVRVEDVRTSSSRLPSAPVSLESFTKKAVAMAASSDRQEPSSLSSLFRSLPEPEKLLRNDNPRFACHDSMHIVIGGGVAIFHLATARVVLCYHTLEHYWFLPKGRRDAGEESGRGAEREGFEESGYRNRLLPLPISHLQPAAHNTGSEIRAKPKYTTEPVLTQLLPVSRSKQYLLHWYIAETLPRDVEAATEVTAGSGPIRKYVQPTPFGDDMTLEERIALDGVSFADESKKEQKAEIYEPIHHEGTAVDSEEAQYASYLVPVEEAIKKLKGSGMDYVVRWGWDGIVARTEMEGGEKTSP